MFTFGRCERKLVTWRTSFKLSAASVTVSAKQQTAKILLKNEFEAQSVVSRLAFGQAEGTVATFSAKAESDDFYYAELFW